MNAFAPLLAAIALAQSTPAAAPQGASEAAAIVEPPPPEAKPTQTATDTPAATSTPAAPVSPSPQPPPARRVGEGVKRNPTATPTATPTTAASATSTPTSPPRRAGEAALAADRGEAERVARAFLDALAASDADGLARAAAERFSFDGEMQAGREAIRAAWRQILAGRERSAAPIGSVEILAAADAVARLGPPPARLAPLARAGVLVAVADVGGRSVVLFLARDAGRMAVVGMHD